MVEEWLLILLRSVGLFVLLLLFVPLLGRKPVSGMNWFDYTVGFVAAVMIALIALNVVSNLAYGLIGLGTWLLAAITIQFLVQKYKWAHDRVYGKEIVVIQDGKILEENLQSARLTGEELLSQLRRKNIFKLADVEFAVMEANGDITALLKRERQPLTSRDMGFTALPEKAPQTVLLDGEIMDEALAALGLDRRWLLTELEKIGVNPENVFIGQVDAFGELHLDLFDDTIQIPQPKAKALLLATLKKVEADLLGYSMQTENQVWKQNYMQMAKQVKAMVKELEPHLIK